MSPRGLQPQASVHPGVPRGSERDLLQPSGPRQKPWSCAGSPPALTLQVGLMSKSYRFLSLTMTRICHFSPTLAQLSLRLMTASSGSLNSFPHVRSGHPGLSSEQQKSHQPPDLGPPRCLPRLVTHAGHRRLGSAPPGAETAPAPRPPPRSTLHTLWTSGGFSDTLCSLWMPHLHGATPPAWNNSLSPARFTCDLLLSPQVSAQPSLTQRNHP